MDYFPNHDVVHRNEMAGVPDFTRYLSRKSPFEGKGATITTVDPLKVVSAHKQTKTTIPDACPFG